jgi:hypothetical protein
VNSYDVQVKEIIKRTDRTAPKPYRLRRDAGPLGPRPATE